jgi:hypothetical protein
MTLHFGLSTLQGKLENMRDGQLKFTFTPTIRHSLRLLGTPTTNTKGNDMSIFSWNESKSERILELQSENVKLRSELDEVLESNCELDAQVILLQSAHDDLLAENKSLHNIGMQYRESAERLKKERDDLKLRLDDCLTKICTLHERVAVLENAIKTAVSISDLYATE